MNRRTYGYDDTKAYFGDSDFTMKGESHVRFKTFTTGLPSVQVSNGVQDFLNGVQLRYNTAINGVRQ